MSDVLDIPLDVNEAAGRGLVSAIPGELVRKLYRAGLDRKTAQGLVDKLAHDMAAAAIQLGANAAALAAMRPAEVRTFRSVTLEECAERGPVWLVQGLIEQSGVSAVTGEAGSAKSFFLIDLALHIAAGRDWFGHKTQRTAVIYIAAEAAESIKRRAALLRRVKFGGATLPIRIVCEPALLGDERASVIDRAGIEALIDAVAAEFGLSVGAVFVDTIAASMGGGNENQDGMQRVVGASNMIAGTTGAAVILNHHPNTTGGNLRGHSSLRGTVSHGFLIDVQGDVRVVSAFKQRDAQSGRLFAYRLDVYQLNRPDNFGDPATSCVIQPADIPETKDEAAASEHTRLTLVASEAVTAGKGEVVRFAAIVERCREACPFLGGKSDDGVRKAVGRALKTLTTAGVISRCKSPHGGYRRPNGNVT